MSTGVLMGAAQTSVNKISEEISKNFLRKIIKHFKDENIKYDIDSGYLFENYITNVKNKYEKVKTIINSTPLNLSDLYETVEIRCGKVCIDTDNVNDIFNLGNKMILIGTAGIGKTMTMRHLFLQTIDIGDYTPVYIELRSINDSDMDSFDLEEYINEILNNMGLELEYEYFKYSMKSGCYTIFLDGFDELNDLCVKKVEKEIVRVSDKYSLNKFLISSRPMNQFTGWNDFVELNSLPLTKNKALSLVKKLPYYENAKTKFYKALKEELYDKYKSFASNPLLLTIMLITFNTNAKIPDNLNEFYEQAFYSLFYRHDASKGTYERQKRCQLEGEQFKRVFSYICFKSFFDTKLEFDDSLLYKYLKRAKEKLKLDFRERDYIYDLEHCVCLVVKDGLNYKFSHRSFQEYFAALYTVQLNDNNQSELLKRAVRKTQFRIYTSNYLKMLNDLEETRFFNNFLKKGLKTLFDVFQSVDYNIYKLVKIIVEGIKIVPHYNQYVFIIKNSYLYNIIYLTLRNKKEVVKFKYELPKELMNEIMDTFNDENEKDGYIKIPLLEKIHLDTKVIDYMPIKHHLEFILDGYDDLINFDSTQNETFDDFLNSL